MSTKKTTRTNSNPAPKLEVAALKKTVFSLQKKLAKLEAELFTAKNTIKIQAPIVVAAKKASDKQHELRRLANEALRSVGDASELL